MWLLFWFPLISAWLEVNVSSYEKWWLLCCSLELLLHISSWLPICYLVYLITEWYIKWMFWLVFPSDYKFMSAGRHMPIGDGSAESECSRKRILWWHQEEEQAYHLISSYALVLVYISLHGKVLLAFSWHFLWFADMLPGLKEGQEKMSKSDPSSSIYMEDEEV